MHMDADAFFASCEQAINPSLKGKPVVTGKERNIVAAASYEAKALGISRGVALWEAKKMCPALVVLPSDYETYCIFSKRMFDIFRRYTPTVEEYSIDEAFGELTGLRRLYHASYKEIAQRVQNDIHKELGITVSVGVSVTKTLAKLAAKKRKPAGFMSINAKEHLEVLRGLPVENIWNIGANTAELLRRYGLGDSYDFAVAEEKLLSKILHKPGLQVWHEINGRSVFPVCVDEKTSYQSISKVKTFAPPSGEKEFVFAQLLRNVEGACIKARRYSLAPKKIIIFLREKDFRTKGAEAVLSRPSAFPLELAGTVRKVFEPLFKKGYLYRSTGVVLTDLYPNKPTQRSLFENPLQLEKMTRIYGVVDELRLKYGKYVVHQGSALNALDIQFDEKMRRSSRNSVADRKTNLLKGETKRRRLPLPLLKIKV